MMAPLFDHAFVINLDRDVHKWEDARRHFDERNIDVERWRAVNGWELDHSHVAHLVAQRTRMNPAEIGCFVSHLTVWLEALRRGYERVAVFEDDARTELCADQLRNALLTACQHIGREFDVLYLGKCCDRCDRHTVAGPGLVRIHRTVCAHAYVISTTAVQRMLSLLPTSQPVDEWMASEVEGGSLIAYAFHPSLFVQAVNKYQSALREAKDTKANVTECLPRLPSPPWHRLVTVLLLIAFLVMLALLGRRLLSR